MNVTSEADSLCSRALGSRSSKAAARSAPAANGTATRCMRRADIRFASNNNPPINEKRLPARLAPISKAIRSFINLFM